MDDRVYLLVAIIRQYSDWEMHKNYLRKSLVEVQDEVIREFVQGEIGGRGERYFSVLEKSVRRLFPEFGDEEIKILKNIF